MTLNDIYHSLNPVAISLGPLQVHWYGLAYLLAFVLGGVIIYKLQNRWRLKLDADEIMSVIVGIALGVIVGARLGYVLFYGAGYYLQNPLEIFMLSQGGMSFHGGLVGAIVGGSIACRTLGISIRTMIDLGVIAAPLGLFFGRCANFVNGELWGKPSDLPWAVVFETGGNVARHPSQLYEALLEGLVIFIVLFALSRKNPPRPQGTFLGTFLVLYGVFRFAVEFVRMPDAQLGYLFGFVTMGQLLSLPLIVVGIIELVLAARRGWSQRGHVAGWDTTDTD